MIRSLWLALALLGVGPCRGAEIPAVVYHDIVAGKSPDRFALARADFAEQMAWLQAEGYAPVSLALLERVRQGTARLPDKPVLLTFDDGLVSYAEQAFPVLQRYGFPSVLSVVTGWADGQNIPPEYRGKILDWEALRRLSRSPLVEIISHTDNLHHGVRSNPQGNEAPAVITRTYDATAARYESEAGFRGRIRTDLERTRARLSRELGRAPVGIAWPFGQYDQVAVEEANRVGLVYQLTLDREPTRPETLPRINRATFHRYKNLSSFIDAVTFREQRVEQIRFVQIDLAVFAHESATQQDALLSALLRRLELLRVNAVVVRPLTTDSRRAFFYNRVMPVEGDILNRILHQIRTRLGIHHIYLQVPLAIGNVNTSCLYTDLARLHRFSGVVLDGAERGGVDETVTTIRYYQPALRIGTRGNTDSSIQLDFIFSEIDAALDPAAIATAARRVLAASPDAWLLLRWRAGVNDNRLRDALRAVREAGARHYGYGYDDFVSGTPRVLPIVAELHGHTIAGPVP
jgi:peptidoglycan/xylan/chitin deacetylase (PgdA/CDA1 family)